jgi:hypothetical protein
VFAGCCGLPSDYAFDYATPSELSRIQLAARALVLLLLLLRYGARCPQRPMGDHDVEPPTWSALGLTAEGPCD